MMSTMETARPRVPGFHREGHRIGARVPAALLASSLLLALGCSIDMPPADFAACGPAPPAPDAGSTTPDYWHDAKAIIDTKCASCHVDGGIAPMPLVTYAGVNEWAGLIRNSITRKLMPPWPPNDCCATYQHDRSLSAVELDTLVRWIDAGLPEGDPMGAPPSVPLPPPRLSRVDVTLRMPQPYTPVATEETSELRCFVVEGWPYDEEMFVTGVDVRPGNRAVVHHVIVQTVDESAVPELKAREGRDGRPGFDCRNLRGELHVNGSAGGWTPGTVPQESPDATFGVPFAARSQVLLQVHYDVRAGVTMPDQMEIDFQVAKTVKHRLRGMVVVNPLWLANDGLDIGAGDPDAVHNFAYDPTVFFSKGDPLYIHGVNLHMHFLGSRGRIGIHRADGSWDCLLDIPEWDYHWSSWYQLAEPVKLNPGDLLYVECHWDNTAGNQTPIDGVVPAPHDQHWATAQEMCAGLLSFTDRWP
jgi:hypothetical protein